jgi:hypothetical protein
MGCCDEMGCLQGVRQPLQHQVHGPLRRTLFSGPVVVITSRTRGLLDFTSTRSCNETNCSSCIIQFINCYSPCTASPSPIHSSSNKTDQTRDPTSQIPWRRHPHPKHGKGATSLPLRGVSTTRETRTYEPYRPTGSFNSATAPPMPNSRHTHAHCPQTAHKMCRDHTSSEASPLSVVSASPDY